MNDPVLNRKLFRHKAQIIHKQIPKLQQGGAPWYGSAEGIRGAWQAGPGRHLWDFNRGAAFNTAMLANPLKKAKFAGAALKTGWGYGKKAFGYTGIPALSRFTGKHATKIAKKHPKSYATAKGAVGAAFAVPGAINVGQGIREGDPGKVALGAGETMLGGGIGLRAAQLFARGMQGKKGIGAFKKATKAKAWARKKKLTSPWLSLPLIGGGALTAKDAEAEPGIVFSETDKEEIWQVLKTVAKDIENATEQEINQAIEIWEKQKTVKADDTKPDNLGDTGTNEMKADEVPPGTGSPVTVDEAELLAKQKEKNATNQANVLKTKFDNADMQTQREFLKFRQAITDLTGTYGNDRDLILMKMASGMMTGKTAHTGLKGFLDVTGQAMGPTVDTALALSNAQKGRDTDLATAFLKMKQEQAEAAEGGGMVLKGAQKRFLVKDPASPYGYKVVTGQYNDETGQIMEHLGNQQYRVMQGDPTEIKVSMAQLGKTQTQLGSAAMGLDYVNWVLNDMDDSLKGLKGWAKLKLADWQNLAETYEGKSNKYTQGLNTSDYVDGLLTPENIEGYNDKVEIKDWKGKVIRESTVGQEIRKQYVEEQSEIRENMAKRTSGWDINEEQLFQLTKAALIENRLKYIIANANKSEDRLTRWDIDNAAKNTGILPFITFSQGFTPETVNAKMKVLQGELIGNFNSQARKYQQQGGTNDFLLDFTSVPYIQQFLEAKQAAEMDQQAFIEGLESIELPGVGG
jgi:hypothetical protein